MGVLLPQLGDGRGREEHMDQRHGMSTSIPLNKSGAQLDLVSGVISPWLQKPSTVLPGSGFTLSS